jgi:hypothetical protein
MAEGVAGEDRLAATTPVEAEGVARTAFELKQNLWVSISTGKNLDNFFYPRIMDKFFIQNLMKKIYQTMSEKLLKFNGNKPHENIC